MVQPQRQFEKKEEGEEEGKEEVVVEEAMRIKLEPKFLKIDLQENKSVNVYFSF